MRLPRLVLALAATLAMSPIHQPATAAEVYAAAHQFSGPESFSGEELIASGHRIFGTASQGLAMTVEEAVRRWGEPERLHRRPGGLSRDLRRPALWRRHAPHPQCGGAQDLLA